MAEFVVGHDFAFLGVDKPVLFFQAGHNALDGLLELGHFDLVGFFPDREQGGFIDQVGKICPYHACSHGS